MEKQGKTIKELPKIERPREKLIEKGIENLKDEELLAILLRTGAKDKNVLDLSRQILRKFSKRKFLKLKLDDLVRIKGINKAKASTILAAIEFTKRLLNLGEETLPKVKSKQDVIAQFGYLREKTREHFAVIYLNARNEVIFKKHLFIGTLNSNICHPREVFQYALLHNASSVILVHNHPSGDPEPSEADIVVTKRMVEAGKIMGVEVLDHVIITKNKAVSFKEKKLI